MDYIMPGFPSFTSSQNLLKFISTESVMPSLSSLSACHVNLILWHPLLFLLSTFPASGSFLMSQPFAPGSQSIGASVSASVLPMNIQGQFPLGLTGLISLLSEDSQEPSPTPQFKSISCSVLSLLYG